MSQNNANQGVTLFGWNMQSWMQLKVPPIAETAARIVYCGSLAAAQQQLNLLRNECLPWQVQTVNLDDGDLWTLHTAKGPVFLLKPKVLTEAQKRDGGLLAPSSYSQARDLAGRAVGEIKKFKLGELQLRFEEASKAEQLGALVGLEVAAYSYKTALNPSLQTLPRLLVDVSSDLQNEARALALGTNIARHLVNTPPNLLYPESFAAAINELFSGKPGVAVTIWDAERLQAEGMGLHVAVGRGSDKAPCLVHIRYRPDPKSQEAPLAIVGKGITFDSGGLDIKDPVGMRLMKKDMGGAAAVVGLFSYLLDSACNRPVDVYIPLAENAISGRSYRPGDIIKAKNGMTVEIHNTDAEGRLVLADAMAVAGAQTGVDQPAAILVAATLTGAIKVGLGSDVAGFFATDDELGTVIQRKAQESGDLMWRMPLFDGYRPKLDTTVADINHCASGSYGGAITAALFLAEFAKGVPFAHLDIYAWTDAERGALREPGGSGQAVQALAGVLQSYRR
ncbi:MAG: leucyl aminopeptidase family protein [Oligoflexus sp.]|jgi:leucyl aminopeptidase